MVPGLDWKPIIPAAPSELTLPAGLGYTSVRVATNSLKILDDVNGESINKNFNISIILSMLIPVFILSALAIVVGIVMPIFTPPGPNMGLVFGHF